MSAEVMRLGFEAARQTVGDQARANSYHRALSFSGHPVLSNAAAKPSRLNEDLKPPDNSHKALIRASLIALVEVS